MQSVHMRLDIGPSLSQCNLNVRDNWPPQKVFVICTKESSMPFEHLIKINTQVSFMHNINIPKHNTNYKFHIAQLIWQRIKKIRNLQYWKLISKSNINSDLHSISIGEYTSKFDCLLIYTLSFSFMNIMSLSSNTHFIKYNILFWKRKHFILATNW